MSALWSLRTETADPIGMLASLAARGDFVPFELGRRRAFLLNTPEYAAAVLTSNARKFQKGSATKRAKRLLGNGLLTAEPALNVERRRVIQPSLSRTRLDGLAPEFVSHAKTACAGWQDGDLIDITRAMGRLTFDIVGESIVGARVGHLFDDVRLAVDRATASLDPLISLMAPLSRVGPARRQLRTIVGSLIAARTNGRQDGSLLAHVAPGGDPGLVEQHIDDLLTILLAGHDTLTSALTWAWLLLARHDDARARMLEELSEVTMDGDATPDLLPSLTYTRAVFAETLRLYPPAWVLAREAVESHRFEEGEVPAGAIVLVSQYLLHRDARYFDRPRAFDPGRWLVESPERARSPFFPFGAGSRSCIGESLAWMEGVLILATIAKRWNLRAVGHELPAIDARITLRPASPVMMRVEASGPGR